MLNNEKGTNEADGLGAKSKDDVTLESMNRRLTTEMESGRRYTYAEKGKQKEASEQSRCYSGVPQSISPQPPSPYLSTQSQRHAETKPLCSAVSPSSSPQGSPAASAVCTAPTPSGVSPKVSPAPTPTPRAEVSKNGKISYPLKHISVPCCLEDGISHSELTKDVTIIMQTQNGPCPLLVLVNYFILKGRIRFERGKKYVDFEDMVTALGDLLFPQGHSKSRGSEDGLDGDANPETPDYDLETVLGILPKLQSGLDVDIKFTGIFDFEPGPELLVFQAFGVKLCHGWLADPRDLPLREALGDHLSYNDLTTHLVSLREPDASKCADDKCLARVMMMEQFLVHDSPSQMTAHGLNSLRDQLPPNFLGALFWNNHFHTIWKHKDSGVLFLLVTDDGYRNADDVVWQSLDTFHGESRFFSSTCEPLAQESSFEISDAALPSPVSPIALQKQRELEFSAQMRKEAVRKGSSPSQQANLDPQVESDYALARQIEQMNLHQAAAKQHNSSSGKHSKADSRSKQAQKDIASDSASKKCTIQ